jgi:hypothetical protein
MDLNDSTQEGAKLTVPESDERLRQAVGQIKDEDYSGCLTDVELCTLAWKCALQCTRRVLPAVPDPDGGSIESWLPRLDILLQRIRLTNCKFNKTTMPAFQSLPEEFEGDRRVELV